MSVIRPRQLWLVFAAIVIAALAVWKSTRTYDETGTARTGPAWRPLPPALRFVERDTKFFPVKLSAFLGRHRLLIAFFDGRSGVDNAPLLKRLRSDHAELKRRGYVVLAIGDAHPDENREGSRRAGGFPFEVLADVEAVGSGDVEIDYDTVTAWGRFDADIGRVVPGLFVIDRAGNVKWANGGPVPEADPEATLNEILER